MLDEGISLVGSRTFWAAALALLAQIAIVFKLSSVLNFAQDPHSVDMILQAVSMLGVVSAMLFRVLAKSKVTSAIPPTSTTTTKSLAFFLPVILALALLGGCVTTSTTASVSTPVAKAKTTITKVLAYACPVLANVKASGIALDVDEQGAFNTLDLACPPNPLPTSAVVLAEDAAAAYLILKPLVK